MHDAVLDSSLPTPTVPAANDGLLPFELAGAVRPGGERDKPVVQGRRAQAYAGEDGGIDHVRIGASVLSALRVRDAVLVTTQHTSLGLRRTYNAAGASFCESILCLPDLPAVTIEWSAPAPQVLDIEWEYPATSADSTLRLNQHGGTVTIADDAAHLVTCFAFDRIGATLSVTAAPAHSGAALRIHARVGAGPDGFRLHVTAAMYDAATPDATRDLDTWNSTHHTIADTLDRLRHASSLTRAFAAAQKRRAMTLLSIETPDTALDHDVAWAVQCIATAPIGTIDPLRHVLAALATGDPATARMLMDAVTGDAALLLMYARYHAWTADTSVLHTAWPRIELAAARTIAALDSNADAHAADDKNTVAFMCNALDAIAMTAGDIGQRAFQHAATVCIAQCRTTSTRADAAHLRAITTPDAVLLFLVHDILGIEPEAARNRLRIRPRLPAAWDRARIRNIMCGDASVSLNCQREAGTWTFTASQESGGVPIRLLLEPIIAARSIGGTLVDGVKADLDARRDGDGILVPVQLVLDETRELVVREAV
ncbi:MAG: hypothetical protein ABIV28_02070 [Longimicrobiales bacterium]